MSRLGIGSILYVLGGGSEHSPDEYYGRQIVDANIDEKRLRLKFSDGTVIKLWDNGQSCCEDRYITCDDDVADLIGGNLIKIAVKDYGEEEEEANIHEWVFIEVATDKAFISMTTHNEHNGYYGGFGLTIIEENS